ncbi:metallophosphoesterase family protein [Nisaea denitrificans]|uniref:metallophosphoesterase family protein n=1 Tax=Nisaea denitrificans TaxID=390877 RepID=UPI0004100BC6|nr:metallophosphoesterase [Nisaea denitrificans]
MRILAFSDLHRSVSATRKVVEASSKADVFVAAGDFAIRGEGESDTIAFLKQCGKPVILVHGNHDRPAEVAALCADWVDGHYLHGGAVTLDGVTFTGLGGEIPHRNDAGWNVSESEERAAALLEQAGPATVLVTHAPPFGSADLQKDGSHHGCSAIAEFIRTSQPELCLCGHIHHSWGETDQIGRTRVQNLGPTVNWFDIK